MCFSITLSAANISDKTSVKRNFTQKPLFLPPLRIINLQICGKQRFDSCQNRGLKSNRGLANISGKTGIVLKSRSVSRALYHIKKAVNF